MLVDDRREDASLRLAPGIRGGRGRFAALAIAAAAAAPPTAAGPRVISLEERALLEVLLVLSDDDVVTKGGPLVADSVGEIEGGSMSVSF